MALKLLGGELALVADNHPASRALLDHRHPEVPNVGDITTADWSPWAGRIHWLTAGWPCQPFSAAGKQEGHDDHRAIWPSIARAIRELRPRVLFLENVDRIATGKDRELGRVLGDLALLGFDAEWRCVPASLIGAPHRRRRVFILAVANPRSAELEKQRIEHYGSQFPTTKRGRGKTSANPSDLGPVRTRGSRGRGDGSTNSGNASSYSQSLGRHEGGAESTGLFGRSDVAFSGCIDIDWGVYTEAVRRWEHVFGSSVPAPALTGPRGGQQLDPIFVEWMMGLPSGWVTDVPGMSRNNKLHLLGNGVVPQQALYAYKKMILDMSDAPLPLVSILTRIIQGDLHDRRT